MTKDSKIKLLKCIPSFIVYCIGIWHFFFYSLPTWDAKIGIQDRAGLFSARYKAELEIPLEKLWNQCQTPTFVITGGGQDPYLGKKVFFVSRNLETAKYDLFESQLRRGGFRRKSPRCFELIGSFDSFNEMSDKLLSAVDYYQKDIQSYKKVDSDLINALKALIIIFTLFSFVAGFFWSLYLAYKWLSRKVFLS